METQMGTLGTVLPVVIFLVLTVIPLRLAADMFGVVEARMTTCTAAVLVGTAISYIILKELAGSHFSYAIAFVALVFTFKFILRPSITVAIGLTVVTILIQIIVISAIFSLGKYMNTDIAALLPFLNL